MTQRLPHMTLLHENWSVVFLSFALRSFTLCINHKEHAQSIILYYTPSLASALGFWCYWFTYRKRHPWTAAWWTVHGRVTMSITIVTLRLVCLEMDDRGSSSSMPLGLVHHRPLVVRCSKQIHSFLRRPGQLRIVQPKFGSTDSQLKSLWQFLFSFSVVFFYQKMSEQRNKIPLPFPKGRWWL